MDHQSRQNICAKRFLAKGIISLFLLWIFTDARRLLDFNQELAKFFGGSLSIARPELDQIESCLPRGDLTYHGGQILPANRGNHSGPLRLVMVSDKEIRETKPKDIGRLLELISSPTEGVLLEVGKQGCS